MLKIKVERLTPFVSGIQNATIDMTKFTDPKMK